MPTTQVENKRDLGQRNRMRLIIRKLALSPDGKVQLHERETNIEQPGVEGLAQEMLDKAEQVFSAYKSEISVVAQFVLVVYFIAFPVEEQMRKLFAEELASMRSELAASR